MDNWDDIYLHANDKHAELLKEAKQSRLLNDGLSNRVLLMCTIILIGMVVWWVR